MRQSVGMCVPMSSPDLTASERTAVAEVLQTPILSIGSRVVEFEQRFAAIVGADDAVAVSSGTAGLHLGVLAAGVADGDLVITTPFSFISSANVLLYERAVPVFVDVDPLTGNMDPALVAESIEDLQRGGAAADRWLPRTLRGTAAGRRQPKAILAVHAFGQPCDIGGLEDIACRHHLPLIEDACEAVGAEYSGRKVGTFGDCAVFAFYPNKQMTTGEGGLIVTNDPRLAALFRSLRNQGRDASDGWLQHSRLGYNYRLDEMSAALGNAQLARLDELLLKRQRVAAAYNSRLAAIDGLSLLHIAPATSRMSWFVYVVRLDSAVDRAAVMQALAARGVPSRPYFAPIHLQPFYTERFGYRTGDFATAESWGAHTLALPFSGVMTDEQIAYVCEILADVLRKHA
jgi:perosamine synthetase